jgi:hypothetical protein
MFIAELRTRRARLKRRLRRVELEFIRQQKRALPSRAGG